ncbi:DNA-3-methyladenine glycosylase [Reichenbachiella versicolor]|uniref:DNA-3-methyladenine glycosylase n=1 Tax=Reichenbachiella versicolor TaxID=1821036 RepID=UPI00293710E0|nr:DNA-3-methyladenine glycosylase [Reichenbachiella versicolor]
MKVENKFFQAEDVVSVARQILGMYLVTEIDGERTVGKIVEVEAYRGENDKACQAYIW